MNRFKSASMRPGRLLQNAIQGTLLALAVLSFLMPLSAASPASHPVATLANVPGVGDPILKALSNVMGNPHPTEKQFNLLQMAYMEREGQVPLGMTDIVAASPDATASGPEKEAPPRQLLRDPYMICDVDGDDVNDVAVNVWDRQTGRPSLEVISGADGHNLWYRFGSAFLTPASVARPFGIYNRAGNPDPLQPHNFDPSYDIDNDGVCDLMVVNFTFTGIGIDPQVYQITATFSMLNGTMGVNTYAPQTIWSHSFTSTWVVTFDPSPLGVVTSIVAKDMVTGFIHAATPNGARWIVKTTDIEFHYINTQGQCDVIDWRTQEHITYRKVKDSLELWHHDLNESRADPTAKSQYQVNNITYLTGAAQLAGNSEFEVVLDQLHFTTPFTNGALLGLVPICPLSNPVDGTPVFQYGTGVSALALRGEDGNTLWVTPVYEEGTLKANLQTEENFETYVWHSAAILPDLRGDGVPDVVVFYLMREQNSPTTVNGAFNTHIHPLDGATGKKFWPQSDIKVQGWGFPGSMTPFNSTKTAPYMAFGTVDLPTPVPPAGRFPPKDVRLVALDLKDGSAHWSWREQFAQDSYSSYSMTLQQYRSTLAPHDWNHDGINDLVTPSQYIQPSGANQTLIATSTHRYDILDGETGGAISSVKAWGPNGMVSSCGPDDATLTVFSGHPRRLDVSRFNITPHVEQFWRQTIWNNPNIQSATMGQDLVFFRPKCVAGLDDRILLGLDVGLASAKRGFEVQNLGAMLAKQGTNMSWLSPPLLGKPPIDSDAILKFFDVKAPNPIQSLAMTAGPAVPGVVLGLGMGRLRLRKGGAL